jgi:tetratricopeptide (TPR) repeat protein
MTRRALMDAANIGAIYDELGELGSALEILEPAVREARAHGAPYPLATCLYTLAAVLQKQGRAALALTMGREAVALLSHCPGSPHYVSALQVLGAVALRLEDWPTAQEVFETSLSLRRNPWRRPPPTAMPMWVWPACTSATAGPRRRNTI